MNIRRRLSVPQVTYDNPVYLLPYLTSHFGHWVGDVLGALLLYSRLLADKSSRKIIATAPTKQWQEFLETIVPADTLEFITPSTFLQSNLLFTNAAIVPRLSPWQNLNAAVDILRPHVSSPLSKRSIFLSPYPSSRLSNIEHVIELFSTYNINLVCPSDYSPCDLLNLVYSAKMVWSEPGSIVLNCLIARDAITHVFELHPDYVKDFDPLTFSTGGSIYNGYRRTLLRPFMCDPEVRSGIYDANIHPYQRALRVNISDLDTFLSTHCPS